MNDTLSSLLNFQDTRTPMVDGHPKVETPKLQGANPNWTLNVQLPLNICPKLDDLQNRPQAAHAASKATTTRMPEKRTTGRMVA